MNEIKIKPDIDELYKLYPDLDIGVSILNHSPNHVWVDYSCATMKDALRFYSLLDAIVVPNIRTKYDEYIPLNERCIPSVVLCLRKKGEFRDFNVDKGVCNYGR